METQYPQKGEHPGEMTQGRYDAMRNQAAEVEAKKGKTAQTGGFFDALKGLALIIVVGYLLLDKAAESQWWARGLLDGINWIGCGINWIFFH